MTETTACTFDIRIPFYHWVDKFDTDVATTTSVKDIKVMSKGISKENQKKNIFIVQSLEVF
tara:strand:- start:613 stop:795 length:183 start_codon:yes stop_codon:yes gene_type:complete